MGGWSKRHNHGGLRCFGKIFTNKGENAPALAKRMRAAAVDFLGEENVVDLDLWMAAEDFAYYSQKNDACFYRLGIRNEAKGITSGVHTPTFDIDETALPLQTGTGLMAWLALEELKG